jgi:hypothetical protein
MISMGVIVCLFRFVFFIRIFHRRAGFVRAQILMILSLFVIPVGFFFFSISISRVAVLIFWVSSSIFTMRPVFFVLARCTIAITSTIAWMMGTFCLLLEFFEFEFLPVQLILHRCNSISESFTVSLLFPIFKLLLKLLREADIFSLLMSKLTLLLLKQLYVKFVFLLLVLLHGKRFD